MLGFLAKSSVGGGAQGYGKKEKKEKKEGGAYLGLWQHLWPQFPANTILEKSMKTKRK